MRKIISALTLVATFAIGAGAQQMDHGSMMTMATPCPLHLTTLNLSATQQKVVDSLRTEHMAVMKALMAKAQEGQPAGTMKKMSDADKAAMEKSMGLTLDAVRAILTPAQRATFDAAVTAHEQEMKQHEAMGHDCSDCCAKCCAGDGTMPMMKKPDA